MQQEWSQPSSARAPLRNRLPVRTLDELRVPALAVAPTRRHKLYGHLSIPHSGYARGSLSIERSLPVGLGNESGSRGRPTRVASRRLRARPCGGARASNRCRSSPSGRGDVGQSLPYPTKTCRSVSLEWLAWGGQFEGLSERVVRHLLVGLARSPFTREVLDLLRKSSRVSRDPCCHRRPGCLRE
jgi:hypothetical protein